MSGQVKNNLILTFAHGYRWPELSVFFRSLEACGYQGEVVVFASRLSAETTDHIRRHGGTVVPVWLPLFHLRNILLIPGWKPWKFLLRVLPGIGPKRWLAKRVFNIMCARFAHFQDYLSRNLERHDFVMISDVRDVCFQANPFARVLPGKIVSFLENIPLGQKVNRKWMEEAFGERLDATLFDKPVSCAGVTLGEARVMMKYLDLMLEGLMAVELMTPVAGVDQAIHNEILHHQRLPDVVLFPNGNPLCNTMGHGDPLSLDAEANVLAVDGTKVAILHQFDRIPQVAQPKFTRFRNT